MVEGFRANPTSRPSRPSVIGCLTALGRCRGQTLHPMGLCSPWGFVPLTMLGAAAAAPLKAAAAPTAEATAAAPLGATAAPLGEAAAVLGAAAAPLGAEYPWPRSEQQQQPLSQQQPPPSEQQPPPSEQQPSLPLAQLLFPPLLVLQLHLGCLRTFQVARQQQLQVSAIPSRRGGKLDGQQCIKIAIN